MSLNPEIAKRNSRAQEAFDTLFGGTTGPFPLDDEPVQRAIIVEAVEARTAYCADLRANGFPSPVGFCEETDAIAEFLR